MMYNTKLYNSREDIGEGYKDKVIQSCRIRNLNTNKQFSLARMATSMKGKVNNANGITNIIEHKIDCIF